MCCLSLVLLLQLALAQEGELDPRLFREIEGQVSAIGSEVSSAPVCPPVHVDSFRLRKLNEGPVFFSGLRADFVGLPARAGVESQILLQADRRLAQHSLAVWIQGPQGYRLPLTEAPGPESSESCLGSPEAACAWSLEGGTRAQLHLTLPGLPSAGAYQLAVELPGRRGTHLAHFDVEQHPLGDRLQLPGGLRESRRYEEALLLLDEEEALLFQGAALISCAQEGRRRVCLRLSPALASCAPEASGGPLGRQEGEAFETVASWCSEGSWVSLHASTARGHRQLTRQAQELLPPELTER